MYTPIANAVCTSKQNHRDTVSRKECLALDQRRNGILFLPKDYLNRYRYTRILDVPQIAKDPYMAHLETIKGILKAADVDIPSFGNDLALSVQFIAQKLCRNALTEAYLRQSIQHKTYTGCVLAFSLGEDKHPDEFDGLAAYSVHSVKPHKANNAVQALFIPFICAKKGHSAVPLYSLAYT